MRRFNEWCTRNETVLRLAWMTMMVLVLATLVMGCAASTQTSGTATSARSGLVHALPPSQWVAKSGMINPTDAHRRWWEETLRCLDEQKVAHLDLPLARIDLVSIRAMSLETGNNDYAYGAWTETLPHTIFVVERAQNLKWVLKHEMLHLALQTHNHSAPGFERCDPERSIL